MEGEQRFSTPEEEIQYLEAKIAEKKRELGEHNPRAAVSETLREHSSLAPAPSSPPPQTPPPPPPQDEADRHVALLLEAAFSKGILEAVGQARETHNPYLIDAFHDALVDRFLERLQGKG